MRESTYQKKLIEKICDMFPGAFVMKNDEQRKQGIPDLLILFKNKWAMLEVKESANASVQPNQEFYIDKFKDMSFGAFIYPENEKEVLDGLQLAFRSGRAARVS